MLKILICVCLFGFFTNAVLASGEEDWYDFYEDGSEELPVPDEVQNTLKKHKVEPLGSDEKILDIEPLKTNDIGNEQKQKYDNIADYQIEDNRSEQDIKLDENNNGNFKLLTGDPDLAPPDDMDDLDEGISNNDDNNKDFEDAIKNFLAETDEGTSKKDILEETKAILSEADDNDFESIEQISGENTNNTDNQSAIRETTEILSSIDDSFEDNNNTDIVTKSDEEESSDSLEKALDDLKSDLDTLHETWSKLSSDLDSRINEEFGEEYDYNNDNSNEEDYEEMPDDDFEKLFANDADTQLSDDEKLLDDSHSDEKEPILYLNDALSASDSTPSGTTVAGTSEATDSVYDSDTETTEIADNTTDETTNVSTDSTNLITDSTQMPQDKKSTEDETQLNESTPTIELKSVSVDLTPEPASPVDSKPTNAKLKNGNVEITDLDIKEINKFYGKYKEERQAHSAANITVKVHLNLKDTTTITSPDYPDFYPTEQVVEYVITGDALGIEMNVTEFSINSFVGDYVLVIPGQTEDLGSNGILLTYSLRKERRFRFTDVDRMYIRFESKRGGQFQRGFKITLRNIMPLPSVVELPDEDEVITWTSNATLTVNLGGVSINGFISKRESFRQIIADMATMFINEKGIEPGLNETYEVTRVLSTGLCFHNWPGADQCTEVTFAVPLVYDEEMVQTRKLKPRLTKDDLKEMWSKYSSLDPFAVRLELLGIQEFSYPDEEATMTVWLVVAAGVAFSMAMLAFALWRFSCFEDYSKMPSYSDTDSVNEKRALDLYPTPHQTLPPLYDDLKWDYSKDMGFSNKSYMPDIYDMDSDDETLRPADRYSGAISPRDIYNV